MDDTTSLWNDLPLSLIPSSGKTTSFDDLPPALVTNILSRLPIKTLIRSTSVSKLWYARIKNPNFISYHISRSISNHYILIAPQSLSENSHCEVFSDDETLARHSTLKIPFRTRTGTVRFVGSCNGLMCLTDDKEPYAGRDLYLFNPSIQKYKKLSTDFSCYVDLLENVYKHYPVVGFGFYEPENDYRVVRIIYSGPRVRPRVEVYSLNIGKWRSVSVNVEHVASNNRNAFVDGCLHWLVAKTPRDRIEWVMSFDLKDEVVHEVELPEDYDDDCLDDNVVMSIFNWHGSVGLCVFKSAGDLMQYLNCCFWEMNTDNDGNSSWERKFDFLMMDDPIGLVVGVSCSGKIVIDAFGERKLGERKRVKNKICALNPDDMEFKDLAVDGPYMVDSRFVESLVLLLD